MILMDVLNESEALVEFAQNKINRICEDNPAVARLGAKPGKVDNDFSVELLLDVDETHTNIHGIVHGGVFITLLDSAMGYACSIKAGKGVVTLNLTTSFIANCNKNEQVRIIGKVVHAGRRITIATGDVVSEKGKILATAQGTFFVLGEHPVEPVYAPDTLSCN